jgi:hypothetical protein
MISTVQTAKLFIELFLYTIGNRTAEPTIRAEFEEKYFNTQSKYNLLNTSELFTVTSSSFLKTYLTRLI